MKTILDPINGNTKKRTLFIGVIVILFGVLLWSTISSRINESNMLGFKFISLFSRETVTNSDGKAYYYTFEINHTLDKKNLDNVVMKFAKEFTENDFPRATVAFFYKPGKAPKLSQALSVEDVWKIINDNENPIYFYYEDGATPAVLEKNPKGPWK